MTNIYLRNKDSKEVLTKFIKNNFSGSFVISRKPCKWYSIFFEEKNIILYGKFREDKLIITNQAYRTQKKHQTRLMLVTKPDQIIKKDGWLFIEATKGYSHLVFTKNENENTFSIIFDALGNGCNSHYQFSTDKIADFQHSVLEIFDKQSIHNIPWLLKMECERYGVFTT